jgi:hypothetical protein
MRGRRNALVTKEVGVKPSCVFISARHRIRLGGNTPPCEFKWIPEGFHGKRNFTAHIRPMRRCPALAL